YRAAIEAEAAAVTARYPGSLEVQVADDFPQSVAAYKQYDVLLVNAVYDGLNLVAKEGPLVNARDGVLVLSENAGAHAELGEWALTVNPFDVWGQAEALHEALGMEPAERRARADEIADTVVAETGKPRVEAFTTELFPALDALIWLAKQAPKLLAPERVRYPQLQLKHKRASLHYEPIGVVGVIAPWNFPFAI